MDHKTTTMICLNQAKQTVKKNQKCRISAKSKVREKVKRPHKARSLLQQTILLKGQARYCHHFSTLSPQIKTDRAQLKNHQQ